MKWDQNMASKTKGWFDDIYGGVLFNKQRMSMRFKTTCSKKTNLDKQKNKNKKKLNF